MSLFSVQSNDEPGNLFPGLHLAFSPNCRVGVIGPSGAGKSTLLRVMAGLEGSFRGQVRTPDQTFRVGYLPQDPLRGERSSTGEFLERSIRELRAIEARYNEIVMDLEGREQEFERLQSQMDEHNIWDLDSRIEQACRALLLPALDARIDELPVSERRRVALCALLLSQHDLLLLDDPTSGLDVETAEWLGHHLNELPGILVTVTSDRSFLENCAQDILELDDFRVRKFEGNYSAYLLARCSPLHISSPETPITREFRWSRMTPPQQGSRATVRIARFAELQATRSGAEADSTDFRLPSGPRLGQQVLIFERVVLRQGERVLLPELTFDLRPGATLGVVGATPAQKFALLDLIASASQPTSGTVRTGALVQVQLTDSSKQSFDESTTVSEALATSGDEAKRLARFAFTAAALQTRLADASPGLRQHVALALGLARPCNLLLLDDPTRGLDLPTIRSLEDALAEFSRSAMLFTDDVHLLNRICTDIIAFDGAGGVQFHPGGNYASYRKWRDGQKRRRGR